MSRSKTTRISLLHFAGEIELVPFDQPLSIPEGMSPVHPAAPCEWTRLAPTATEPVRPVPSRAGGRTLLPLLHPAA